MNPMQLIQMIRNGQNPQQLTLNMLESQMGNNPFGAILPSRIKQKRQNKQLEIFYPKEDQTMTRSLLTLRKYFLKGGT